MTSEHDEAFRATIIAAVQAELDRHAKVVIAETAQLRADAAKDREAIRASFGEQLKQLAQAVQQSQGRTDAANQQLRDALDARVTATEAKILEAEGRSTRRLEELSAGLDALVEAVARPKLQAVTDQHEATVRRVDALAENLRRFDEQAARMVTFVDETSKRMDVKAEERSVALTAMIEARMAEMNARVDEADAAAIRRHTETSQMVTQRAQDIEDRINQRVLTFESRVKEDTGTRIAEIDAHVGRVSAGLDETLTVLNDRMAAIEKWLQGLDDRVETMREAVEKVDTTALDELKDKLSAAAGEAVLLRIDLEKLQKGSGEKFDAIGLRVTEVETALEDATMDVSTAVQLERLEELERAVMELDPTKFVTKDDQRTGHGAA